MQPVIDNKPLYVAIMGSNKFSESEREEIAQSYVDKYTKTDSSIFR